MENMSITGEIINLEWEQFTNAKNLGERSYCQDRKTNFFISRKAYWSIYSEEIRTLYLEDLKEYNKKGIELVTQKYAYMMKDTAPEYFKLIEPKLIPISEYKENLVSLLMYISRAWLKEIESSLKDTGVRPLYKSGDSLKITSAQTYLKGEYMSYSDKTLTAILIYFVENFFKKNNLLIKNIKELRRYS